MTWRLVHEGAHQSAVEVDGAIAGGISRVAPGRWIARHAPRPGTVRRIPGEHRNRRDAAQAVHTAHQQWQQEQ